MSKPKLALIPSGYKSGKVYSILPNDATGDFDFDRASEGTRVRKDGLIEEITDDVPRLDWLNSNCPSLLLEPQRTNYATNNTSMDTYSTLGGSSPSPTLTSDYTIAPDGTLTATRLQVSTTGTNYSLIQFPTTTLGNGDYTASVYVKSNTGSSQSIAFYGQSSSPNQRTATTEWTRIEFTGNRGTGLTKYVYLGTWNSNLGTDADLDISIWGAQIEVDSDYASSLIYTGGTAVTRLKDECLNGGDSDLFDITEGTFFVDANNFGTPLNSYSMITFSDGGNNFIRLIYESTRIRVTIYNGATQNDHFITGVNDNERNKIAITFKENEFKAYLNGVLKDTDTSGVVPTNFDRLNFASQSGTSRHFEGKVYDTRVYDRVLTEAEAIEITTL